MTGDAQAVGSVETNYTVRDDELSIDTVCEKSHDRYVKNSLPLNLYAYVAICKGANDLCSAVSMLRRKPN